MNWKICSLGNMHPSALEIALRQSLGPWGANCLRGRIFQYISAVYHDMIKDSDQRNLPVSRISLRRPKQTSVHIDKNFVLFISWKLHWISKTQILYIFNFNQPCILIKVNEYSPTKLSAKDSKQEIAPLISTNVFLITYSVLLFLFFLIIILFL